MTDPCVAVFHDLHNAPGILFTAPQGALPSGKNGFWIQQFHGKDHHVGRTIIEFWTNNVLTALVGTILVSKSLHDLIFFRLYLVQE